jgi:hypothetical protein
MMGYNDAAPTALVGRAVLCPPNARMQKDGAHGVTRPTILRSKERWTETGWQNKVAVNSLMRDDFKEKIKQTLAQRVNGHCSNPSCRTHTSAPQKNPAKAVNIGVAAHISAATRGGPRFDETMTTQQRSSIENGIWLCQNCAKLIDNDTLRFSSLHLRKWKADAELEASERLGKTFSSIGHRAIKAEKQVKRDLKLRDKMHKDFLKSIEERRLLKPPQRPYSKFAHSEAIIRDVDDKLYPEIDSTRRPSGWFKVELYDFYHNGLLVIVWLSRGVIDKKGRWAIIEHKALFDTTQFQEIKIWHLGKIPWRNIRLYDLDGDEYYNMPHIWCTFANGQGPYEGIQFALLGENHDWPLDDKKRIRQEDVIKH